MSEKPRNDDNYVPELDFEEELERHAKRAYKAIWNRARELAEIEAQGEPPYRLTREHAAAAAEIILGARKKSPAIHFDIFISYSTVDELLGRFV